MDLDRVILLAAYGWIAGHSAFAAYVFVRFSVQSERAHAPRIVAFMLAILIVVGLLVFARALNSYGVIDLGPTLLFAVLGCIAALILAGVSFSAREKWGAITR